MTASRPGFGQRHPDLAALLGAHRPAATQEMSWADGTMPLLVSAYHGVPDPPDELVSSIRCIVQVGDRIVVCRAPDALHPWPGGRRQAGETHWETAYREVHEETGWFIEPEPFAKLGWLHLEHMNPMPADWEYPHPDFVQTVYLATANRREGGHDADWVDTEGWEQSSGLMTLDRAKACVSSQLLTHVFLDHVIQALRRAPHTSGTGRRLPGTA